MSPSKTIRLVVLAAAVSLAACAMPPVASDGAGAKRWQGRLAITIQSPLEQMPSQSLTGGFELRGDPQVGELTLYTPLGGTVAALSWSPTNARLRSAGETRDFESLEAMLRHTVGTALPLTALFAWLTGENREVAGWQADLSQYAAGRILARRTEAGSETQIRLILEK
jgi:outer membrane lipoprotein LolB